MAAYDATLAALLAEIPAGGAIDLDSLAARIEPLELDYEATGELIDALERAGRSVGSQEPVRARDDLAIVLAAARALRAERGRAPGASELAQRTGLSTLAVWRALRFGRIVGR